MRAPSLKTMAAMALAGCLGAGLLGMAGCAGEPAASSAASANSSAATSAANTGYRVFSEDELLSGKHHVVLNVEGYEPITIELDADAAPQTVTNFAELVQDGYYDGLSFYRIVDDFCLQGGTMGNNAAGNDPALDEIQGEFSGNGIENPLADEFDRGTVAMARTSMPNSATSTFFVTLGTNQQVGTSLDGQYAAFGTIGADGMVTIDQIVADYLPAVSDPQMGAIADQAAQPKITSIQWID